MRDKETGFGHEIIFSSIKGMGKYRMGGRGIAEMKKEEQKIFSVTTK